MTDLTASLISFWELEAAAGSRVDSVTATGNNLTSNNGVTRAAGKVGFAASFDRASSQYLSHASNASLQIGNIDFTVAAWFTLNALDAWHHLVSKWNGSTNEYVLTHSSSAAGGSDKARMYVNGAFVDASSFGVLDVATWYFAVGWYDSVADKIKICVNDGVVDSTDYATGAVAGDSEFQIGDLQGSSDYQDGLIDQVGFWKRTLTAAEITWLYNGGAGRTFAAIAATAATVAGRSRSRSDRRSFLVCP